MVIRKQISHGYQNLNCYSHVALDSGDISQLHAFKIQDVTTNPSLMLRALQSPQYQHLLKKALCISSKQGINGWVDSLSVNLGCEILELISGRVSTEVDPRLSFDTHATVARARGLADLYRAEGVSLDRVMIKIAATWEGIQAAKQLELEGIRTNLTLVFSFAQAVACAQAKVQLISPFVGRIYDWHKKVAGLAWVEEANSGINDPGVQSVHAIYNYFKHFDIPTEIMGASFRNLGQILALSGCDLLTISPELLQQLAEYEQPLQAQLPDGQSLPNSALRSAKLPATFPALSVEAAKAMDLQPVHFDEASFRWALNEDAMATEKLAEGIRAFAADTRKLEALIQAH
jgi:transaldolase